MVSGRTISFMAAGNFSSKMAHTIKELFDMEMLKVKVDIFSITDVHMKVTLKIVMLTARGFISILSSTINTVDNGKMMFLMVMGRKSFLMVLIIKEILLLEQRKAMDTMSVSQEFIKGISRKEISMGKALSLIRMVGFIREGGLMDLSQAMGFLLGQMAIDTRDSM